jgi:hypothetical protein
VRTAAIFYGGLLLLALAWRTGWVGEPLFYADAEAARSGAQPLRDAALGAAAAAAVIFLSGVVTRATAWGERLARALAGLLGRPRLGEIAFLALASGIGEEAFFRGALQPRVGLVLASLIFGLAHLVPRREFLPWTGFSLAAGFLLGGLFAWTGNLIAPVVCHALVNGVNLRLLVRDYGTPEPPRSV